MSDSFNPPDGPAPADQWPVGEVTDGHGPDGRAAGGYLVDSQPPNQWPGNSWTEPEDRTAGAAWGEPGVVGRSPMSDSIPGDGAGAFAGPSQFGAPTTAYGVPGFAAPSYSQTGPLDPSMPYPASDHLMPPPTSRRANRKVEIAAGIVALVVVIVGVVLVTGTSGSGNPAAQPTPDISSLLQQLNSQPTGTPTPAPTALPEAATCVASLAACLVAAPSGSSPLNDSWGHSPSAETASQYVNYFYSSDDTFTKGGLKARLSAIGETAIAKQTWLMPDGVEVDDELLSFSTENGAQSWYDSDTDGESGTAFAIPGAQQSVQGYDRSPDSSGIGWTIVYGYSDSTAMALWVEKKGKNDSADASTLAPTQMQAIDAQKSQRVVPVAPSPSAAPFTPAGGGSAACAAGAVDSCLVARPTGSQVWAGKPYYATTDVTVQQYVDDNWNPSDQTNMIQILNDAGVQKIAHRDWTTTTDLQADVTVLQYDSASDAQTQDESFQSTLVGATFSIDGISAQGAVRTMNTNGDVDVEISGDSGPYQVVVNSFSPATADVDAAVQLFEQEFDLLPAR